jgi:DMSO/TMAO reductase YedYZ molybdopterin-dependent catalytic subunit
MPLEALRYPITPVGLHYLLIHYDVPVVEGADWALQIRGERELSLGLAELRERPRVELAVTMECAGNGRAKFDPRPVSQPWLLEAVGTARWAGTALRPLLEEAGLTETAVEVLFTGLDRGIEGGIEQRYQRSLLVDEAMRDEILLAYEMNGAPLPPQHGFPLRLVVPGWYGCTCIKWLDSIEEVSDDVPATSQMTEFAGRTMQNGTPELARDYLPATIDLAAMPVRVEEWLLDGEPVHRAVGIAWGGTTTDTPLSVALGDAPFEPIACLPQREASTWGLWEHSFRASSSGVFAIRCRSDDRRVRARRLNSGYYTREIEIV